MKTYYIVESRNSDGNKVWMAHTGLRARLGWFDFINCISDTYTSISPNYCENKLRLSLISKSFQPRVVRVVSIPKEQKLETPIE